MRRVTDLHLGFLPRDLGEYLQACAKYLIFISVFWHATAHYMNFANAPYYK